MAVEETYQEYVKDLLAQAGLPVTHRAIFGGAGLFYRHKIVGVIVDDELYLKLINPPSGKQDQKRFGRQ